MVKKKVVVHFKDNTLIKGITSDFFPNQEIFHVKVRGGVDKMVRIRELKGLFFVKDFEGNKKHQDSSVENDAVSGYKVKVNFHDGEEVIGFTNKYTPEWPGFFMVPADKGSNNEHIFVVRSACLQVGFIV